MNDPLRSNAQSVDERTMGRLGEQHEVVVCDIAGRKSVQSSAGDVGGNQTLEHRKCFDQRISGRLLRRPQRHIEPASLAMVGVIENLDDTAS